jgi:hypothetical protein
MRCEQVMKDRFAYRPRMGKRDGIQDKVEVRALSRKITSPYFLLKRILSPSWCDHEYSMTCSRETTIPVPLAGIDVDLCPCIVPVSEFFFARKPFSRLDLLWYMLCCAMTALSRR